ncbi:hypothetical protein Plec18167_002220 [Paecilomyces lecythidis]|uniref:Histone H2A/H2B/H3 domain-containing protein n=1 Tax=Paecilomyces lecythidis TaxID=3004212 RepID=A0ABR3Y971_9EURO
MRGTVYAHHIEYNVPAQNGTWNIFQLVDFRTKQVVGWFLAHSEINAEGELDRILRVAGSPYECDHGSSVNTEATSAAGVFLVNRYDWGPFDERSLDVIEESEFDDTNASESLGIVDLAHARIMVSRWREQRPDQRQWSAHGSWLHIPHAEYMFGRFGFDDEHVAARSFLFFSLHTRFTHTTFAGLRRTLRTEETPEERFERRLHESFDFSGLDTIRDWSSPSEADRHGPYNPGEHILRHQDLAALRHVSSVGDLVESWEGIILDLINEMILSYLERSVVHQIANQTVSAAAESLFPHHTDTGQPIHYDVLFYRHFTQPHADPITEFDTISVTSRIRRFITSRFGYSSIAFSNECVAGTCRVISFMVTEVLEMANNRACDAQRPTIMPCDIRMAVVTSGELSHLYFSKIFWEGRLNLNR